MTEFEHSTDCESIIKDLEKKLAETDTVLEEYRKLIVVRDNELKQLFWDKGMLEQKLAETTANKETQMGAADLLAGACLEFEDEIKELEQKLAETVIDCQSEFFEKVQAQRKLAIAVEALRKIGQDDWRYHGIAQEALAKIDPDQIPK